MFSQNFLLYINKKFIEICKRSQVMCPKRLWPFLFKDGKMALQFNTLEDDANKYYLLVNDIYEELNKNKDVMNNLGETNKNWIVRSRSTRIHRGELKQFDLGDKLSSPLSEKYKPKNTEVPISLNSLFDLILEIDEIHNFNFYDFIANSR